MRLLLVAGLVAGAFAVCTEDVLDSGTWTETADNTDHAALAHAGEAGKTCTDYTRSCGDAAWGDVAGGECSQNTCTCSEAGDGYDAATATVAAGTTDCITEGGDICVADANCDAVDAWPQANDEASSEQTCPAGKTGSWTRACNNGVFAAAVDTCAQNTCSCTSSGDGYDAATTTVAATGADCTSEAGDICTADANCDAVDAWPQANDEASSEQNCPAGKTGSWTRACNNGVFAAAVDTCAQNTCTCSADGTNYNAETHTAVATGADCTSEAGDICAANPEEAENACTCVNGNGSTGADCETNDTADCATCNANFEIVGGATAAAGDECVAAVCTCTGGVAATDDCDASGEQCASCTAFQQWKAEVLPVAAAEEDDAATEIDETVEIVAADEVPGIAGFHAGTDEDSTDDVMEAWTCVADVCVCSDPAVNNADDALDDVANSGTEDVPVWANHWAAGMQTAATGMWCTGNGDDVCVADPTMCDSAHACGADWTIMTDLSAACATDTCTDAECCTEDASASASVEEEEKATHECTCADDAADTCAEAVKEDTVVDEATCTAVDGGAWTKLAKVESEEDASSAAAVSAVVALIAFLL